MKLVGDDFANPFAARKSTNHGWSPSGAGGVSDHAPGANVATVFCGDIKEFVPIGNIAKNNPNDNPGTWGLLIGAAGVGMLAYHGIANRFR